MNKFYAPDFLIIPRALIIDRKIKTAGAFVYGVIYWFYGLKDGECTASNHTIGRVIGMQTKSISNNISNLISGGYVRSEIVQGVRHLIPLLNFGTKRVPAFTMTKMISCFYCGVSGLESPLQLDHFIAKSKGGPTKKENLVLACVSCNAEKGIIDGNTFIHKLKTEGRYLHYLVDRYPSRSVLPLHQIMDPVKNNKENINKNSEDDFKNRKKYEEMVNKSFRGKSMR